MGLRLFECPVQKGNDLSFAALLTRQERREQKCCVVISVYTVEEEKDFDFFI